MKKPKLAKSSPQKPAPDPTNSINIVCKEGDDSGQVAANVFLGPHVINAMALARFSKGSIGEFKLENLVTALATSSKAVNAGDLERFPVSLILAGGFPRIA